MRRFSADSSASPQIAWELFSQPSQWRRWAPHLRPGPGLGEPEVRAGARGWMRVGGVVPVAVRILAVDPGRSWTWRVGPVTMRHLVRARLNGGCEVVIELTAPEPVQTLVAGAYGPVMTVLLANLARVAGELTTPAVAVAVDRPTAHRSAGAR